MQTLTKNLRQILTSLTAPRFDFRTRQYRYELVRFPGQDLRLQWCRFPEEGHFFAWYGAWQLTRWRIPAPPKSLFVRVNNWPIKWTKALGGFYSSATTEGGTLNARNALPAGDPAPPA